METPTEDSTTADLISQLKSDNPRGRSAAIRELCCPEWIGLARRAVKKNGGREADVEDVFQESLMALIRSVQNDRFRGDSKLSTYFFEICRRIYLKRYRPEKAFELNEQIVSGLEKRNAEFSIIDKERKEERSRLTDHVLAQLGKTCRRILTLAKQGYTNDVIAEELGYENPDTVKNQASRCRKKMRAFLEKSPELFHKLKKLQ